MSTDEASRNITPLRAEYIARINRVIDHIETHLQEPLRLETLAGIAAFSPWHFHRIFHAMVGETLSRFIQRLRVERAAMQLAGNPARSIGDVALDSGFASSQTFARAFRERFGMSASDWRAACVAGERNTGNTIRKIRNTDRKIGDASRGGNDDLADGNHQHRSIPMTRSVIPTVTVRDFPETPVAYIRHIGPYQADPELFGRLFGQLFTWAGPRGLLGPDTRVMSIYHDDPNITDGAKLRTDVCISVPPGTAVDGPVGTLTIPAGRYAFARVEVTSDQFGEAWDAVCGDWLPDSGYEPADGLSFEIYHNDHREHPEGKHIVDIAIPVRPMM
ncbi:MAG: AraC family transcriptional regulator [Bacteroidota bacterium]|nr:AraC family transcriptional regulator [Bacteroidota bacterium]